MRPWWWWLALAAETRRFWAEIRTYWPGVVADAIITFSLFAVFVSLGDPGGAAWLGYTVWYLGATVMGEAAISISTDKQWGLLDQLRIKPIGLVTAMSVKTLVWTLFAAAQVVVVVGALTVLFDVPIHFHRTVLPIIALSLIGVFGFTFVVVALTILYTKASSFQAVINYVLLFVTGAVVPLDLLPRWVGAVSRVLPLSLGIAIGRPAAEGTPVAHAEWAWLTVQSLVYVGLGYGVFRLVMRHGERVGIRNRY